MTGVPFDDRGLTLGDGLFETLLARDGDLQRADAHLARMAAGCTALGLPPPDLDEARRLMAAALAQADVRQGLAAVRLTLTAGSGGRGLDRPAQPQVRMFAAASPYAAPSAPALLATVAIRRNETSPAAGLKTLAYLDSVLARDAARALGAEEALMLNTRGEVACAAAANVFWVSEDRLHTPALACGVLPGIVRGAVITAAAAAGVACVETASGLQAAQGAEAVFLTNSLMGLRPVSAWDGQAFGPSRLAERLAAAIG